MEICVIVCALAVVLETFLVIRLVRRVMLLERMCSFTHNFVVCLIESYQEAGVPYCQKCGCFHGPGDDSWRYN